MKPRKPSDRHDNAKALSMALRPLRGSLRTLAQLPAPDDKGKAVDRTPALDHLHAAVPLTRFEMDVLLLCAGAQIDDEMREAVQKMAGNNARDPRPTVAMAIAACRQPDPYAFAPGATLRGADLIRLGNNADLHEAEIQIDETVLHLLVSYTYWDQLLAPMMRLAEDPSIPGEHQDALTDLMTALSATPPPFVWLSTRHPGLALGLATAAAQPGGHFLLNAAALPDDAGDIRRLGLRFRRMLRMLGGVGTVDPAGASQATLRTFLAAAGAPLCLLERSAEDGDAHGPDLLPGHPNLRIDLPPLTGQARTAAWSRALGGGEAQDHWRQPIAQRLAEDFDLTPEQMTGLGAFAQAALAVGEPVDRVERRLRERCRSITRGPLDRLAERVPVRGGLDGIVLPPPVRATLDAIRDHMAGRARLHQEWRFEQFRGGRADGVTALFAGPSGTGKTLAAEKLAGELDLDLYRIDLSQTVSKWVGETEKNLRAVFAAAAGGGAIMLFDEADTLFAKRTDGREAGGQFTNAVVGFLLQEMERFRGLAILTTNRRNAIDDAFQRRLRYIVEFPFPDKEERLRLWQGALPASVPHRGLHLDAAASIPLSGGQIASVVQVAAARAAAAGRPVSTPDLAFAIRLDFAKNGISEALIPTEMRE